jgi:hypothetical protein
MAGAPGALPDTLMQNAARRISGPRFFFSVRWAYFSIELPKL